MRAGGTAGRGGGHVFLSSPPPAPARVASAELPCGPTWQAAGAARPPAHSPPSQRQVVAVRPLHREWSVCSAGRSPLVYSPAVSSVCLRGRLLRGEGGRDPSFRPGLPPRRRGRRDGPRRHRREEAAQGCGCLGTRIEGWSAHPHKPHPGLRPQRSRLRGDPPWAPGAHREAARPPDPEQL